MNYDDDNINNLNAVIIIKIKQLYKLSKIIN